MESVRKEHSPLSGVEEEEKFGGHSQENFWKLEQKYCKFKVFLVLEDNGLKKGKNLFEVHFSYLKKYVLRYACYLKWACLVELMYVKNNNSFVET